MTDEERDRLLKRADRTFGANTIDQAIKPVRAIVGPRMPQGQENAERARDKLRNDEDPTPIELAALEVMIRLLRPALLYRNGQIDDLPVNNEYAAELRQRWADFRPRGAALAFSVGRIDSISGQHLGTGFLVAPDQIVTNHHVLEALSYGTMTLERGQGEIYFEAQWEPADQNGPVAITRVIKDQPFLDIALLEIDAAASAGRQVLAFDDHNPAEGDDVAVVGYPMKDIDRRNPRFTEMLFEGKYDVKRAAPGEIVRTSGQIAFHDCSTLGGNSGSPVVSLDTAKVVGLHRSGTFMYRNEAVQVSDLRNFITSH